MMHASGGDNAWQEADILRHPTEHLAATVRTLRERRRWSQADLALRAGCSGSTVSAIEAGRTNPTLRSMSAVAAALEVPVWRLLHKPWWRR